MTEYSESEGGNRMSWVRRGPAGCIEVWVGRRAHRLGHEGLTRWSISGGVEIHREVGSTDSKGVLPCHLLEGRPCHHDGSSLAFANAIEPLLKVREWIDWAPVLVPPDVGPVCAAVTGTRDGKPRDYFWVWVGPDCAGWGTFTSAETPAEPAETFRDCTPAPKPGLKGEVMAPSANALDAIERVLGKWFEDRFGAVTP